MMEFFINYKKENTSFKNLILDKQSSLYYNYTLLGRCGGIGRHKGLKIPRSKIRTGSSPVSGTMSSVLIVFEKL